MNGRVASVLKERNYTSLWQLCQDLWGNRGRTHHPLGSTAVVWNKSNSCLKPLRKLLYGKMDSPPLDSFFPAVINIECFWFSDTSLLIDLHSLKTCSMCSMPAEIESHQFSITVTSAEKKKLVMIIIRNECLLHIKCFFTSSYRLQNRKSLTTTTKTTVIIKK